jgi:hypothetical protein
MAELVDDTRSLLDRVKACGGYSKTEKGQPGYNEKASGERRLPRCERQGRKKDGSQKAHPHTDLPFTELQTGATRTKILDFVHCRQQNPTKHDREEDRHERQ